jgi:hypothetical protein
VRTPAAGEMSHDCRVTRRALPFPKLTAHRVSSWVKFRRTTPPFWSSTTNPLSAGSSAKGLVSGPASIHQPFLGLLRRTKLRQRTRSGSAINGRPSSTQASGCAYGSVFTLERDTRTQNTRCIVRVGHALGTACVGQGSNSVGTVCTAKVPQCVAASLRSMHI